RSILMTRAPMSASWRVAKGPAIACSSVTTVTPASGCIARSGDGCASVHGEPAVVVARPQADLIAVRVRFAADEEVVDVEQRTHGAEFVAGHDGLGHLPAQEVEQQGRDERAVHDETGIALFLRDVAAIVVDTMRVERQGRIAKEQDIV